MQIINKALLLSAALITPTMALALERSKAPLDSALINQERIAYWLAKRGEISDQDTLNEKQAKVNAFIDKFRRNNKRDFRLPKNYQPSKLSHKLIKSKSAEKQLANVTANTQVNVLAILIDFPDLPYNNNRLSSRDTDLFYPHYSPEHYTNLLYSATGFSGPNGENLMSAKQYYAQESGNTFDFSGAVFGWYRAKNSSEFYGKNSDGTNDQNAQALVVEAIEAAVATGGVDLVDYDKKDPRDIDQDGNFNEPDGEIDHVLIIHSSIGEEAGGGVLGANAIWSHRFSVTDANSAITGSSVKVKNYTVQPIDSGAGVVVHEFGHDLGLDDEYDLESTIIGAPVGSWSVMASGSWLGEIRGTQPTVFSPLGREKLQQAFGGNWINQQVVKASDLTASAVDISLQQASNHDTGVNQVKIELPLRKELFGQPQQGSYQLLAAHKDQTHYRYAKSIDVPDVANVSLSLWAKWDIEEGYDYAQVLINGQPLSNQYTVVNSPNISGANNFITGSITGTPWTELTFDISSYRNQTVELNVDYVTDPAVGGFGLALDNIGLVYESQTHLVEDFELETAQTAQNGQVSFSRISAYKDTAPDYYYLQLRSQEKLDLGLKTKRYEPGVIVWYRNEAYTNNNSSEHAGFGFISVIDADQTLIRPGDTGRQIRDAAFSLYPQTDVSGDSHLAAISIFNDAVDYTSKGQLQSGTQIPLWGINLLITQQDSNSNSASLSLSKDEILLTSEIVDNRDGLSVSFMNKTISSYQITEYLWDFGDGTTASIPNPTHTYGSTGSRDISLKVTDTSGAQTTVLKTIILGSPITVTATDTVSGFDVILSSDVEGGVAPFTYLWDFGDDTTSALNTLTHSYAQVGNYQVALTVTDAIGQEKSTTVDLTIQSNINIDFSYTKDNQIVSFTGVVSDSLGTTTVTWDFGDNGTSTVLSPSHTYAAAGIYTVKMTVKDESGTVKVLTKQVRVTVPIKIDEDSSSGGGSFGITSLLLLCLMVGRRSRFIVKND